MSLRQHYQVLDQPEIPKLRRIDPTDARISIPGNEDETASRPKQLSQSLQ